jgi:protein O-mannosyl-transferase
MSKSVIATLSLALVVVIWWKRGKISWKQDILPLFPFFIIGTAAGLFTAWVERKLIGAEGSEFNFSIVERVLIAGRAIWFYLSKLFWPADLIFVYPRCASARRSGGNTYFRQQRCYWLRYWGG